jgi:hypothetical protein
MWVSLLARAAFLVREETRVLAQQLAQDHGT